MRKVLVTGGVRGIGFAIAKEFQKKGYRVCVSYSKDEESAKRKNVRLRSQRKYAEQTLELNKRYLR